MKLDPGYYVLHVREDGSYAWANIPTPSDEAHLSLGQLAEQLLLPAYVCVRDLERKRNAEPS